MPIPINNRDTKIKSADLALLASAASLRFAGRALSQLSQRSRVRRCRPRDRYDHVLYGFASSMVIQSLSFLLKPTARPSSYEYPAPLHSCGSSPPRLACSIGIPPALSCCRTWINQGIITLDQRDRLLGRLVVRDCVTMSAERCACTAV